MTWLTGRREFARHCKDAGYPERVTALPIITIAGERQTGKTEMLIDRLVSHASEGLRIAYVGQTLKYAAEVQRRIEHRDIPGAVSHRGHGREAVRFDSGGAIRFLAASKDSGRGLCIDILAWDDVDKPISDEWKCALMASPGPLIYRVITE